MLCYAAALSLQAPALMSKFVNNQKCHGISAVRAPASLPQQHSAAMAGLKRNNDESHHLSRNDHAELRSKLCNSALLHSQGSLEGKNRHSQSPHKYTSGQWHIKQEGIHNSTGPKRTTECRNKQDLNIKATADMRIRNSILWHGRNEKLYDIQDRMDI